jgi:hypothetical protein
MCLVAIVCDIPSVLAAPDKLPRATAFENTCIPVTRSVIT